MADLMSPRHPCLCGCGGDPKRGRYLPGHDSKHRSQRLKDARGGDAEAAAMLRELGGAHGEMLEMPCFARITGDPSLATLLQHRWQEAENCRRAKAYLASVVMMGSAVEGGILAVINMHPTETSRARTSPKDKNGRPKPLGQWSLAALIDVAHELGWLRTDVQKFSHVLRDYRNLVHPWAQHSADSDPHSGTCDLCRKTAIMAISDLITASKK